MDGITIRRYRDKKLNVTIIVGYESILDEYDTTIRSFRPGNGGCRIESYDSEAAAVRECRTLTKVMSFKHAVYSTGFSGAKLVVHCPGQIPDERVPLLQEIAKVLLELQGKVLTGCDMNTDFSDMVKLHKMTKTNNPVHSLVLSGLNSKCDPNVATAFGVVASVQELAKFLKKGNSVLTVLVLGTGKVGSHVGRLLQQLSEFNVIVSDVVPGLASENIPGALDISGKDWTSSKFDIFCPCAGSHLIDESIAQKILCRGICGSSNAPITNDETLALLRKRNIIVVPESISSAGAIIEDSVEYYDPFNFKRSSKAHIYGFISSQVAYRTRNFLNRATKRGKQIHEVDIHDIIQPDMLPVGCRFSSWIAENESCIDVAVIGAGMAGSSCVYNLAKERYPGSVALFEQGTVCDVLGSSNGDSRMYREMYSDPFYSRLMSKSLPMWSELEKESGISLLSRNGLLFFGSRSTGETAEGSVPGAIQTVKELGIEHKVFSNCEELKSRFRGLQPGEDDIGVFSYSDGSVNSSEACHAMVKYAKSNGTRVRENVTVLGSYAKDDDCDSTLLLNHWDVVRVRKKLVLTTGAWTPAFLKYNFNFEMQGIVQMVAWGHFELPDEEEDLPQWFCFRSGTHFKLPMSPDQHGLYYGFPAVPSHGSAKTKRMVKVGTDFTPDCAYAGGHVTKADQRNVHKELRDDIRAFIRCHWPSLGDEVDLQYSPYHTTPSNDFVLGTVPKVQDTILFCGGSGRAFKFAPLIGACLADLVQEKKTRVDISRFDPLRVMNHGMKQEDTPMNENGGDSAFGKSHVPFSEKGEGVYSLATQGCFDVINNAKEVVLNQFEEAIRKHGFSDACKEPVVLCDFGAADGGTSLELWNDVIAKCQSILPDTEIEMKYEDQPNADFQSLFYYTKGLIRVPGRTEKTYLEKVGSEKVFVSAIGTSFYEQCLPSASLTFGFSSTAMHWLSKTPKLNLPSGIVHHTQAKDARIESTWAKQAADDWEAILLVRAAEMREGGRIVLVNFVVDNSGQCLGNTRDVPRCMFDEMSVHWKSMMEDGLITKEEYDRTQILNYYRSIQELTAPLLNEESKVYKAGLRLETASTFVTPCPYRANWLQCKEDAKRHGESLVMTMRTWSNSSFASSLEKTRGANDSKRICDEFYSRFARAISENPSEYGMDYVHGIVSIRKCK